MDDREVPIKRIKMSPVSRCEIFTGAAVCFMETRPVCQRRVGVAAHKVFREIPVEPGDIRLLDGSNIFAIEFGDLL